MGLLPPPPPGTISDMACEILFKFFNREIQDKYKNVLTSDAKVS